MQRQLETEQINGRDARDHDRQRSGEPFQNIICVLHHHRNDQPPARLQHDQVVDETVVTEEKSLLLYQLAVVGETRDQTERNGAETQLHVPHPDADVAALEYFLEVDPRETGEDASGKCSHEAEEAVLFLCGLCNGVVARLSELHEDYSDDEGEEGDPLRFQQLLLQDEHSKDGRGQDFQLIGHLKQDNSVVCQGFSVSMSLSLAFNQKDQLLKN